MLRNTKIDVEGTKAFYHAYHQITQGCDCIYCKNYVIATELLPNAVKVFYQSLGIDPTKEGEVSEYCKNEDGSHLYGGFYHVKGRIISGPDCWIKTSEKVSHLETNNLVEISGIKFGFTHGVSLLLDGFPNPAVQLEFEGNIPWVLEEKA
ncbi:hypothetical protein ACK8P5_05410 [Paenibacillus sp. EC2-1]|uniref:hypothetical protein n=1 Tax=Paenibacillus sp. EC2-1 TaxID=3388665 RepID=UPI003BEEB646